MTVNQTATWSELIALSRNVAPKTQSFSSLRREDERTEESFTTPADHAPMFGHASKMAFHIVYEIENVNAKHRIWIRHPYPGDVPFNKEHHFMGHESRQILDGIMPCSYGIITFDASGIEERKEMINTAKFLWRKGWTDSDGVRYRVIYSHVNTSGFMLLVPVSSKITNARQIGLFISENRKAPKRVQRAAAAHSFMLELKNPTHFTVATGEVYVGHLANGRKVSILVVNMDLLNKKETAFLDGSGVANLPEFNGSTGTLLGEFGMGKGVYASNDRMSDYDFYLYGPKSEVVYHGNSIFIGTLMRTEAHEARLDLQTITNGGFYDDNLATKLGIDAMNKAADTIIFGDDEDAVLDYMTPFVNASNKARAKNNNESPEWTAIRMLKMQWESKATPAGFRRLVNTVIKDNFQVSRGRVPVPGALRVYVRPNPLCMMPNGLPDFGLDELGNMTIDGLKAVCIPDMPEGQTLILRNPNTHRNEMLLVKNTHLAGLMQYKGEGWCFLGSNADEILPPLNGADMDDNFVAIQDVDFIAKWNSLSYPSQPKDETSERKAGSQRVENARRRYITGGNAWTVSVFEQQLKEWAEPSDSLGSFINRGWVDTLESSEHRPVIAESITNKTYRKPTNFHAPSRAELLDIIDGSLHKIIPVDYTATEENFVALCAKFNEVKPDFITAHAMSNSDQVIDWEVMKKGDKLAIEKLHAEAKKALKTPYFPMCFANRIPADRIKAGNYILVETKLCRMINQLQSHLDGILEDARQMEHMLKRPLPSRLLDLYPADEGIRSIVKQLNSWWARQFIAAKAANGGALPKNAYKDIANGFDTNEPIKDANGKTIEMRVVHHLGLFDFYTQQFVEDGNGHLTLTGKPWSMTTRRKIGIHMLNMEYEAAKDPIVGEDGFTQSVADGKPGFIFDDILDAMEEEGMTGLRVFVDLAVHPKTAVDVKVVAGNVYNRSNDKLLSKTSNPELPDGVYTMSPKGIIKVYESVAELHSSFKAELVAARANDEMLATDEFAFEE